MDWQNIVEQIEQFIRNNQVYVLPVVFLISFAESLAFLSLFVPATAILLGIGFLLSSAEIPIVPVWGAATAGAFLGDWVSYFLGYHYKDRIGDIRPFSQNKILLQKGHDFFEKWGIIGVFIGRFFGPLRAVVPLVAGICAMNKWPFQIANITSAMVWAAGMLAPGVLGLSFFLGD